jgi:putative ABC transport system ATP-binding protein
MIELASVKKVFNAGKPSEFVALVGIDLHIEENRVTVIKGPSGSGKTTLLSIVGCMSRPTAGRVRLRGRDISGLPERFLADIRRRTFGFIFQQPNLIRGISVLENVMLPAYPLGEPHAKLLRKAGAGLAQLHLSPKAASNVEWLSGGEAQRAAIARALINDPAIIIADEPTAHLDTHLSQQFMEIIGTLKGEGKTVIIASHDPLVSECGVVDRVIGLRDGKIEGEAS